MSYTRTKPSDNVSQTQARLAHIQAHFLTREPKLQGKVCVITGVGSVKGIGRASAFLFAREGAKHLYLLDFDGSNLPSLAHELKEKFPDVKVTIFQGDAADELLVARICRQAVEEESRLDVFFANAGIATSQFLPDVSAEGFMHTLRVNTLSCFLAVKHASEWMRRTSESKIEGGGSIILTASISGLRSGAGTVDYSASKAAVNSIAMTSAYQLQRTNIRVNSLCPGLIETGMTTTTFDYARSRGNEAKLGQLNPLGRYGVSEEIAQMALFLASDDASYVNGQNIAVDGGLSSSHPVIPGRWA
ncbi:NADP-binding protein [Dacryopinax primogenitus]|uniref:NADP-binding protein n=1 Tax=Dacryopinax primogenitus (strain DJM 731) TaxID=1858805 RepID=M5G776_DACPD|nr:NADP-binding protein [Dacryopinax primogenitus]EJU04055.1 NADP-binding protein [Dacryopinax primogenitus]